MPDKATDEIREQMRALRLDDQSLGELLSIPPGRVKSIIEKGDASADELVKLRILKGNVRAHLDRLRSKRVMSWQGERHDGVYVPYGGSGSIQDGTSPQ